MKRKVFTTNRTQNRPKNLYLNKNENENKNAFYSDREFDAIIDLEAEDKLSREEMYHEKKLKEKLLACGISYETQIIAPYGMRAKENKNKIFPNLI